MMSRFMTAIIAATGFNLLAAASVTPLDVQSPHVAISDASPPLAAVSAAGVFVNADSAQRDSDNGRQDHDDALALAHQRRTATSFVGSAAQFTAGISNGAVLELTQSFSLATYLYINGVSLTVHGNGLAISGSGDTQCFKVHGTGTTVIMQGLTVANCHKDYGGAFYLSGSVKLFLVGVALHSNSASWYGAAIYSSGSNAIMLVGSSNSQAIYLSGAGSVTSYSACNEDSYYAGVGTSICESGSTSCTWVSNLVGDCTACPTGQYVAFLARCIFVLNDFAFPHSSVAPSCWCLVRSFVSTLNAQVFVLRCPRLLCLGPRVHCRRPRRVRHVGTRPNPE